MPRLADSAFCFAHDPRRGQERAKARKRGGQNRRTPPADVPERPKLRDVGAIQEIIERATGDTLIQENSAARSRTLGYLSQIALSALDIGEHEARIQALEEQLGAIARPRRA
jgi:hypothetical protein